MITGKSDFQTVPIVFKGNWSLEEQEPIIQIISEKDQQYFEDRFYNYWSFNKLDSGFLIGKRVTWDMGTISGDTVSQIVERLKEYYE